MDEDISPQFQRPPHYRPRWPWVVLALLAGIAFFNSHYNWFPWPWVTAVPPPATVVPEKVTVRVEPPPTTIDVNKIREKADPAQTNLTQKRKADFGLKDSVDAVIGTEESFRVGQETVKLQDIVSQIESEARRLGVPTGATKAGQAPATKPGQVKITEETLGKPGSPAVESARPAPTFYGVHVVKPGDNLWDIHLAVLREYLAKRGVNISPTADRPKDGRSTGVGRILKYAEKMVYIFNMKTKQLDKNLSVLEPDEKVIVFNLTRLDLILGTLKPGDFDRVQFDGRDLYLATPNPPAKNP